MRVGAGALAASVAVVGGGSCVAPTSRVAVAAAPQQLVTAPTPTAHPAVEWSASEGIAIEGRPRQGGVIFGRLFGDARNLTLDGAPVAVASDGRFVIGFSYDAPPRALLRALHADGRTGDLYLDVEQRDWPTETIASVPRFAQPSAEFARLRAPELAAINAARSIDGGSNGWRQKFIWPVTGRISGQFGSYRIYANGEKGAPHSGVDVARPTGTPVVAPADGVVILAADRPYTLEGNLLMIDHGMGLNSAFLHLSRIDVRVGDRVRQGQPLGAVGMTGRASGPHLHWGMKWRDRRIDPAPLAGPMPAAGQAGAR